MIKFIKAVNKRVFHKISYGLYIVASRKGEKLNGQIANTVFQVTSNPPTIAISINKENLTHEFIRESKVFSVNILSVETSLEFIGLFGFKSGRDINKFENVNYFLGQTSSPIIKDHTVGYLEAEVIDSLDCGTHTLFLGRVVEGDILKDEEPMTYAFYHQIKGGKSPEKAPTYIEEVEIKEERKMSKYRCTICGYVYDPEKGDPNAGIKPGTSFEKLSEDWVCPVCGASKDQFEEL